MASIIHRVEPDDTHDYRGREFAIPPDRLDVKCFPDHIEFNWHTAISPFDVGQVLEQNVVPRSRVDTSSVVVIPSGTGNPEVDDNKIPLDEWENKIYMTGMSEAKRLDFEIDGIVGSCVERPEPKHETLLAGDGKPLRHLFSLRGPINDERTVTLFERLYHLTGRLGLDDRNRMLESAIEFITESQTQL